MGESYTHLMIPVSKDFRPTATVVCQFLEKMTHAGMIGAEQTIKFHGLAKDEPARQDIARLLRSGWNPFARRIQPLDPFGRPNLVTVFTRRVAHSRQLSAVPHILAEDESQEYDVFVASGVPPSNPPLNVGFPENGVWQPWSKPYWLQIVIRVRNSLVRLYYPQRNDDPESLRRGYRIPPFDQDCDENELDGIFQHPDYPEAIGVPYGGCGRFWVEFEYGKWLYPKLEGGCLRLLHPDLTRLAIDTFGTEFVEGCSWG
jgi:hypothetical protein